MRNCNSVGVELHVNWVQLQSEARNPQNHQIITIYFNASSTSFLPLPLMIFVWFLHSSVVTWKPKKRHTEEWKNIYSGVLISFQSRLNAMRDRKCKSWRNETRWNWFNGYWHKAFQNVTPCWLMKIKLSKRDLRKIFCNLILLALERNWMGKLMTFVKLKCVLLWHLKRRWKFVHMCILSARVSVS